LEECGFAELTPELCYIAENGEGDILGAASRPGLSLFGSEAVRNVSVLRLLLQLLTILAFSGILNCVVVFDVFTTC
jgi:hypothetical protein